MTWTKLSDDFAERLADKELSRSARLLLVELYIYGNRRTLDGRIPVARVQQATDSTVWRNELEELREADEVTISGGIVHLDWAHQDDAATVKARRDRSAAKQKAYRERQAKHSVGDHSACHPNYCPDLRNPVTNPGHVNPNVEGFVTTSRPVPDPSRRDRGQGDGSAPADARPTVPQGRSGGHRFVAAIDEPDYCGVCTKTRPEHIEAVA